jgi:hypothetical protein
MTSLQQTAMLGGAASAKTASYTLVAADAGTAISMSNASATTITVNTALFAAGDTVHVTNLGAGVCTITAGTATVNSSASLALAQYESGFLDFTSTSAAIFVKGAGAAAASGGMTLIETLSLTGASVTSSTIAGTYKDLFLIIRNFRPANAGNLPKMRFNSDSGTRYATTGLNVNSLANQTFNATSLDAGFDARSDTSTQGLCALTIYDYANTTTWKMINWQMFSNDLTTATNWNYRGGRGIFNQTGAITTITLLCDGSGFTSGSALIYGLK